MPIKCEVFSDLGMILTIITGSIDDKASLENARAMSSLPGFDSSFDQLIDMTGITADLVTSEGLKELAKISPFKPGSRRAFIIAENSLVTKTDFYSKLLEIKSEKIFLTHDREKAYQWLMKEKLDPNKK